MNDKTKEMKLEELVKRALLTKPETVIISEIRGEDAFRIVEGMSVGNYKRRKKVIVLDGP